MNTIKLVKHTFVFMRHSLWLLSLLTILFFSCTSTKQIAKSARETVLKNKALQTAHVGISIFEPATSKYWFNYQGKKYFVPASNTKLPTCYAAMKYLGDSLVGLRYRYQDYLKTFYIIPTGDPTFLHPDFTTNKVLEFYKKNIDKKFEFDITNTWDEFPLGNGWSWNDFDAAYMAERSPFPIYGNIVQFKKQDEIKIFEKDSNTIIAQGIKTYPKYFEKQFHGNIPYGNTHDSIKINREFNKNLFTVRFSASKFNSTEIPFVSNGAVTYLKLLNDTIGLHWANTLGDNPMNEEISFSGGKATFGRGGWSKNLLVDRRDYTVIHSQPTDSLLKPMMHHSDNFFAEQSLLMVSNELLGVMNDSKIIDTLLKTDFKDLPQKPRWVDGSGLSRYNLFSPQDFVFILNKMKTDFGMERIKNILPTGNEGTLGSRFVTDSNYIFAKTGTLSGVVALSGFLYTKKNKLLIFSVLVNNHNASASEVRSAVEKFVHGIREKY
jgi:serine-type D-Ala-D-Ala carboxypeptidase/endopeptidase (penicillin-binding protein 4)